MNEQLTKQELSELASKCYDLARQWKGLAADSRTERERNQYLRRAKECFEKAQDFERQAKS